MPRTTRTTPAPLAAARRLAAAALLASAALAATPREGAAQTDARSTGQSAAQTDARSAARPDARPDATAPLGGRLELRPFAGAFVPTGDQRDLLEDAVFTGGQLAYRLHRNVSVVGTFAWAPTTDKTTWGPAGARRRDEAVDLYQYDLGVEGRLPELVASAAWSLSPFGTLGAGGRTYDYRDVAGADARTNFVGYVGAGAELAPRGGRWGVRVEARDHVSAFKGLRGELTERKARNDVTIAAGRTVNFGGR